jgi:hypothetical protein
VRNILGFFVVLSFWFSSFFLIIHPSIHLPMSSPCSVCRTLQDVFLYSIYCLLPSALVLSHTSYFVSHLRIRPVSHFLLSSLAFTLAPYLGRLITTTRFEQIRQSIPLHEPEARFSLDPSASTAPYADWARVLLYTPDDEAFRGFMGC